MDPVIIEVALNGGTRRTSNPNVPLSVDELVADALACLDAGAAIVHQHDDFAAMTERSAAGMAALSGAMYRRVLAERPDALLYPTANFPAGPGTAMWEHHELLAAERLIKLALLDPGSVTLGGLDAEGVPTGGVVYGFSFSDIAHIAARCSALRLGPSIAIFEPGFLRTIVAYRRAGRLPAGAMVKLYFGGDRLPFGLPPTERSLEVYLELMENAELEWAVAVLGGDVIASGVARAALERGGHLRVGLEDFAGPRTPTNRELVTEAVELAATVGRPAASSAEALALLGL